MALRRPPTRVELKADDIEEYNQVMREKEMAMQDSHVSTPRFAGSRNVAKPSNAMERKQVAAERIGIGRPRAG